MARKKAREEDKRQASLMEETASEAEDDVSVKHNGSLPEPETKKKMTRYKDKWHPELLVNPFLLLPFFILDTLAYLYFVLAHAIRSRGTHEERVEKVREQVNQWRTSEDPRMMCTARPGWMSITQQKIGYKDKMYRVNVDLDQVVEVNKDEMTVTVEPSVCIGFLNRFLVKQGYTLPIVPELDCLTIGGLVMGGGIESTSHKYGLWEHISLEYEIITADGKLLKANPEVNSELFHAIPFSYGTLGFLAAVKLRMIVYKPYIKLTYRPTYSLDQTVKLLDTETNKESGNDSVEGIVYSKDKAVIMTGVFVDEEEVEKSKINRMGLWYKPWFYKHVQTFLDKGETVEYVPTLHFHQRHNKACFWLAYIWLPWAHNILARFLMGWLLPMNTQFLKFLKELFIKDDYDDDFILQDFILPIQHVKAGIELSSEISDVWPLWMVPCRVYEQGVNSKGGKGRYLRAGDVMHVDLGIYGHSFLDDYRGRDETLRIFEQFTLKHDGCQALYAETLLTYTEFSTMFDRELYIKMRDKLPYCKKAFPTVYQKVSRLGRQGIIN